MKLTAEVRMQIAEEVAKQLNDLPGATLKVIQNEIDARVESTEKHYKRLFVVTSVLLGVLLTGFFGLTWQSVTSKVSALLADTEIRTKMEEVATMHAEVKKQKERWDQLASELAEKNEALKAALASLKDSERIVRYNEAGNLVLATPDGSIRIMQKGGSHSGAILNASGDHFQISFLGPFVYDDVKHNQIVRMTSGGF